MSADQVRQLYFQNPRFGFHLVQVSTRRLLENCATTEALRRAECRTGSARRRRPDRRWSAITAARRWRNDHDDFDDDDADRAGRGARPGPCSGALAERRRGARPAMLRSGDRSHHRPRPSNVGDVKVCNDATTLTVTYEATLPLVPARRPTCTSRPATTPSIPQNKSGHPKPGQLRLRRRVVTAWSARPPSRSRSTEIGTAGSSPGDTVVIAAHAEVEERRARGGRLGRGHPLRRARHPAMYFTYEVQEGACDCVVAGFVRQSHGAWRSAGADASGSCAAACAAVGGAYDMATRDYAASGAVASLANCSSGFAAPWGWPPMIDGRRPLAPGFVAVHAGALL